MANTEKKVKITKENFTKYLEDLSNNVKILNEALEQDAPFNKFIKEHPTELNKLNAIQLSYFGVQYDQLKNYADQINEVLMSLKQCEIVNENFVNDTCNTVFNEAGKLIQEYVALVDAREKTVLLESINNSNVHTDL